MERNSIARAARLFVAARRTGHRLDRLPEDARPRDDAGSLAIQRATVAELNDSVAGWKVGATPEHGLLVGLLVRSRVFANAADIPSRDMPMLGVEAEIAFRFDQALPRRKRDYEREEIEAAITAFPAIEIVDSRFQDYFGTPSIERAADFMSNGGFVIGGLCPTWRSLHLPDLEACLSIDGIDRVRRVGGHPAGDPVKPVVDFMNHLGQWEDVPEGAVITTGSCTGLEFANPGSVVAVTFEGIGSVSCHFV